MDILKIKKFFCENKFNIILAVIWIIAAVIAMLHHELWRDEAQVWCIVRDLNFIDVVKTAQIEGHPLLWYIILFPFAKLKTGVLLMQVISLALVFAAVLLILFKSPFNKFEKVIVIFSAGMIYYLPVVARNYSLIPVLLFTLACMLPKRAKFPYWFTVIIVLLSNTHLYMLGFSLVLSLFFCAERIGEYFKTKEIKNIIPAVILLVNFLLLCLSFYPAAGANYALESVIKENLSFYSLFILAAKALSFPIFKNAEVLRKYFGIISVLVFYPFLIAFMFSLLKTSKKLALTALMGIIYLFIVFKSVYFGGILYQKIYIIFLILIFCYWCIKQNPETVSKCAHISFYVLFLTSLIVSPFVIADEYRYNFSGGKQIAEYIKKNLNDENTFIAYGNPFLYSSISAYLPDKKLYNVITETYISYYSFSKDKTPDKSEFPTGAVYNIVQEDIDVSQNPYFEFVYSSDEMNISSKPPREVFKIYRLSYK